MTPLIVSRRKRNWYRVSVARRGQIALRLRQLQIACLSVTFKGIRTACPTCHSLRRYGLRSWTIFFTSRIRPMHVSSTDTPRLMQYFRSGRTAQFEFCVNWNSVYMWPTLHVCTKEYRWNRNLNTLEHDRLQHDCTAACVIAQLYSSANFFSLRFHLRKE